MSARAAPCEVDPLNESQAEPGRDAGDDLTIGVLAHEDRDALVTVRVEEREHLPVPEHEDRRLAPPRGARRILRG